MKTNPKKNFMENLSMQNLRINNDKLEIDNPSKINILPVSRKDTLESVQGLVEKGELPNIEEESSASSWSIQEEKKNASDVSLLIDSHNNDQEKKSNLSQKSSHSSQINKDNEEYERNNKRIVTMGPDL